MRTRTLITAGATALLVGVLPTAALAQDTTNDPGDVDGTFVPTPPTEETADAQADRPPDSEPSTDELPNTGGGMAALGGLAVAGAAAVRGLRR